MVVIIGAFLHEPWWDEAQAWLIARDSSAGELFTRVIRYEGHPPLWYLIVAVPAKLGLPYWWLRVVGVLGGAATTFLLLYRFPFIPIYVYTIAPFTLFIVYQYTVIARSYVLLGPLLLLVAHVYEKRGERPALFTLLLILMSHVSVHGFAMACGLFALSALRLPRRAAAAFALNALLLVVLLWPPPDITSSIHLHSPLSLKRHSQIVTTIVPAVFWTALDDRDPMVAVTMVAAALIALTVLVAWIFRSGAGLPFTAALLGVYAVSLRYHSMWHEGLFFLLLLFGSVLAFARRRAPRWLHVAGQAVLLLLLLRHAQWGLQSLLYDMRHPTTGSKAAAEFIRAKGLDRRVLYGTGAGIIELQPYFAANIFDNYRSDGRAYWDWSARNAWPYVAFTPGSEAAMTRFMDGVLAARPEYILFCAGVLEDELFAPRLFANAAYRHVDVFTGETWWKDRRQWETTYHLFERVNPPVPNGTRPASAPRTGAR